MSSIRVPVISQIVALGVKRGTADMSPYVRRAAAQAIPKCYGLDPNTLPMLIEQLSILLGDRQYYVVGPAVQAFLELCPDRVDLIHPHYRSLVRKLIDMDEWGQLATLRLMMVYARKCFPRRTRKVKKPVEGERIEKLKKGFYDEDSETESKEDDGAEDGEEVIIYDPDLKLFLDSAKPLLQSRNSAVIVAVARCYLYLADTTYLDLAIPPLISLLRSSPDIRAIALYNIVQICLIRPKPFIRYTTHFLISATDSPTVQDLKLELLTLIFPHAPPHSRSLILTELSHFSASPSPTLVRAAVSAIGRCAQTAPTQALSDRCLHLLLSQLSSSDTHLVASSLDVIRQLIQRDPTSHARTIVKLAKNLDSLTAPAARANIVWLAGEFAASTPEKDISADVLRILTRTFADEDEVVQQQILLLAARVYLRYLNSVKATDPTAGTAANGDLPSVGLNESHTIPKLYNHILLLCRYSTSYDLRDRARVFRNLLATPSSTELATLLLLAPKPVPLAPSPSESRKNFVVGSASLVIGEAAGSGLRGYEDLPAWVKEGDEPDPKLRAETGYGVQEKKLSAAEQLDVAAGGKANGLDGAPKATGVPKTLDDWLEEDGGEEEETEEETEEEEEEEESEEEEETEEEESGDEMEKFLND
jgi:vesicle coat complex subunit